MYVDPTFIPPEMERQLREFAKKPPVDSPTQGSKSNTTKDEWQVEPHRPIDR